MALELSPPNVGAELLSRELDIVRRLRARALRVREGVADGGDGKHTPAGRHQLAMVAACRAGVKHMHVGRRRREGDHIA
jgi:hypothetical protein